MNSKSFHRGPSNIISSLILFNICHCRILVMIEFRREIAKGDIGGGLVLRWKISIQKDNPKILQIDSGIIARSIGAGSGGFSSDASPLLSLTPQNAYNMLTTSTLNKVSYHSLTRRCGILQGLALVNRFNINEVCKCCIHWETGTVNLELWSEDRPVSKQSPFAVSHGYEVIGIS
uniref:Uncharacterized protein n=1 Tax=Populus trichocarpa TaxID=3694 RepID=A0A2K2B4V2_POPTR